MNTNTSLQRAISFVGTATKLAEILGISKSAISQWGEQIPAEHCPTIEQATQGRVRCEELNSATNWAYLRTGKTI